MKPGGLEVEASPYISFLETKESTLRIFWFVFSKELMNKPVSLSCGHSACKDCMLHLVRSQGRSKLVARFAGLRSIKPSSTSQFLCRQSLPRSRCNALFRDVPGVVNTKKRKATKHNASIPRGNASMVAWVHFASPSWMITTAFAHTKE